MAEGYDPASGRFDLATSALVLRAAGGRRWFAPGEIASLGMGPPQAVIHLVRLSLDGPPPDAEMAGGRARPPTTHGAI